MGSGEPNYILGRQTLGSHESPEIEMATDNISYIAFREGKWNRVLPNLEIFDSYFINDNIYSGNDVDIDQRRNLHYFVLGQEGVEFANAVKRYDKALNSIKDLILKKEAEIQQNIIGTNINISQFVNLSDKSASLENIDDEISVMKKTIIALEKGREIFSKKLLCPLSVPVTPRDRIEKLLAKNLDNISEDTEKVTRDHIRTHLDDRGENWIEAGLNYIKDDRCPFCGHYVSDSPLIKSYLSYFDATYKSFKKEIHDFDIEMKLLFSEERLLDLQRTITTNDSLADFWGEYVDIDQQSLSFTEIQDVWVKIRSMIEVHLEEKKFNPLESIQMRPDLLVAFRQYNFISQYIKEYNDFVEEANAKIEAKKRSIEDGNINKVKSDLNILENKKIRLIPIIDKLCNNYKKLLKGKSDLTDRKTKAKESLDTHSSAVFSNYESDINNYLESCGAGFRIEKTKTSYSGRMPSVTYSLSIRDTTVDLSSSKKSSYGPCFKNTLSDGDKSTLALIFFLAKLDRDSNLASKIVVFDDPVSSLDSNRRTFTLQQIIRLSKCCNQVIILTHDIYLAHQIFNNKQIDAGTLRIKRKRDSSVIEKWDIESEPLSPYFQNYNVISNFLKQGQRDNAHLYEVVRCIRPLLEGYLRVRFPMEFKSHEWLGDFLKKIREACCNDPLFVLQSKCSELGNINDYTKKYYHEQNLGADLEPINEAELKSYAELALKWIHN